MKASIINVTRGPAQVFGNRKFAMLAIPDKEGTPVPTDPLPGEVRMLLMETMFVGVEDGKTETIGDDGAFGIVASLEAKEVLLTCRFSWSAREGQQMIPDEMLRQFCPSDNSFPAVDLDDEQLGVLGIPVGVLSETAMCVLCHLDLEPTSYLILLLKGRMPE
jgi:hypothetical protein